MVEKGVLLMEIKALEDLRGWARSIFERNGSYAVLFSERQEGVTLEELRKAVELEVERDYMRLPTDADGVPINIYDKMENDEYGVMTVEAVSHTGFSAYSQNGFAMYTPCVNAEEWRHYKPPAVEGLLREFGDWYAHTKGGCDEESIIAEYAAKFELKEENA